MGVGGGGGGGDLLVDTRRQRVKYMNLAHAHDLNQSSIQGFNSFMTKVHIM